MTDAFRSARSGKRDPSSKPARRAPVAGPVPDRASLHEAALRHLTRFAATEAGLVRVLDRRVQRWLRLAEAEGRATEAAPLRTVVRAVARSLVKAGMIDDAAFAAARAARLTRAGRSRRATSAHLAAKGVDAETAGTALLPADTELPASLVYARKRRIGPFRAEITPETRLRDLGALARAGFPREVAERALAMEAEEALTLVTQLKRS